MDLLTYRSQPPGEYTRCNIEYISIVDDAQHDAMSYCWGAQPSPNARSYAAVRGSTSQNFYDTLTRCERKTCQSGYR